MRACRGTRKRCGSCHTKVYRVQVLARPGAHASVRLPTASAPQKKWRATGNQTTQRAATYLAKHLANLWARNKISPCSNYSRLSRIVLACVVAKFRVHERRLHIRRHRDGTRSLRQRASWLSPTLIESTRMLFRDSLLVLCSRTPRRGVAAGMRRSAQRSTDRPSMETWRMTKVQKKRPTLNRQPWPQKRAANVARAAMVVHQRGRRRAFRCMLQKMGHWVLF